jgi:hypothetical protein
VDPAGPDGDIHRVGFGIVGKVGHGTRILPPRINMVGPTPGNASVLSGIAEKRRLSSHDGWNTFPYELPPSRIHGTGRSSNGFVAEQQEYSRNQVVRNFHRPLPAPAAGPPARHRRGPATDSHRQTRRSAVIDPSGRFVAGLGLGVEGVPDSMQCAYNFHASEWHSGGRRRRHRTDFSRCGGAR